MPTVAHTYPLTMPTSPKPVNTQWRHDTVVGSSTSVFTRHTYTVEHPGSQWFVSASYPPMTKTQAREWLAFLLKMKGKKGSCLFIDYDFNEPGGSISGSPVVNGASQTGNAVNLSGLAVSGSNLLIAGDQISFAGYDYMHRVVDPLSSDAGGLGQVVFEPALKASPANGAAVQFQNVGSKMMLQNSSIEWDSDALQVFGLTLDLMERIED